MRRKPTAVLMILLCLLTACSSKENTDLQAPMDFRTQLLQTGACTFSADMTADYGESIQQFSVRCECQTDGTSNIEVIAPETIAGIAAQISDDGSTLNFEDMAVSFAPLAKGNVAPVSAPVLLVTAWTQAYISTAGREGELRRITYENGFDERQLTVDCWFDEKNVPICAEICYNNETVLKIEITDFSFVSGGNNDATEEDMGGYLTG